MIEIPFIEWHNQEAGQDIIAALGKSFSTWAVPPDMNLLVALYTYETYDGDHLNKIHERLRTKAFPFFSKNLVAK